MTEFDFEKIEEKKLEIEKLIFELSRTYKLLGELPIRFSPMSTGGKLCKSLDRARNHLQVIDGDVFDRLDKI